MLLRLSLNFLICLGRWRQLTEFGCFFNRSQFINAEQFLRLEKYFDWLVRCSASYSKLDKMRAQRSIKSMQFFLCLKSKIFQIQSSILIFLQKKCFFFFFKKPYEFKEFRQIKLGTYCAKLIYWKSSYSQDVHACFAVLSFVLVENVTIFEKLNTEQSKVMKKDGYNYTVILFKLTSNKWILRLRNKWIKMLIDLTFYCKRMFLLKKLYRLHILFTN